MKKLGFILTVVACLAGNVAHAQTGKGASAGSNGASDFSWGIAIGGLAVLGVVVGVTAAAASSTPSTFSH